MAENIFYFWAFVGIFGVYFIIKSIRPSLMEDYAMLAIISFCSGFFYWTLVGVVHLYIFGA